MSAVCRMCQVFGRKEGLSEEDDGRKRKRTLNVKYYSLPFRVDNIKRHLNLQHAQRWEDYTGLNEAQKKDYITARQPASVANQRAFVNPEASSQNHRLATQKITFYVDANIVHKVIGDLLFDADVEDPESDPAKARSRASKIFVPVDDEDNDESSSEEERNVEVYCATVTSVLKLNLLVKFVAVEVSFRQASRLYISVKEEIGFGVLGCVNDTDVAQLCRVICAVNLQTLKDVCRSVWALSISRRWE